MKRYLITCILLLPVWMYAQQMTVRTKGGVIDNSPASGLIRDVWTDTWDKTGETVAVWKEYDGSLPGYEIYMALFDAEMKMKSGWPQKINTLSSGDETYPIVRIDQEKQHFAVAWLSQAGYAKVQVRLRVYDATGTPLSSFTAGERVACATTNTTKHSIRLAFESGTNGANANNVFIVFGVTGNKTSIRANSMNPNTGVLTQGSDYSMAAPGGANTYLGDAEYGFPNSGGTKRLAIAYHEYSTSVSNSVIRMSAAAPGFSGAATVINADESSPGVAVTGQHEPCMDLHTGTGDVVLSFSERQTSVVDRIRAKVIRVDFTNTASPITTLVAKHTVHNSTAPLSDYTQTQSIPMWSEATQHILYAFSDATVLTTQNSYSLVNPSISVVMYEYCPAAGGTYTGYKGVPGPGQYDARKMNIHFSNGTSTDQYLYGDDFTTCVTSQNLKLVAGYDLQQTGYTTAISSIWNIPVRRASYARLSRTEDANVYPSAADFILIEYTSPKTGGSLSFAFVDEAAKAPVNPCPVQNGSGSCTLTLQADVNLYALYVPGLTNGKTYFVKVVSPEGNTEYLRVYKRGDFWCNP